MRVWYVIQVVGGQEKPTLDLVQRFVGDDVLEEAFIPQRETRRSRAGRWVTTNEVLFPGYLFAVTDAPDALFAQLSHVPAFTRLLGSDERFLPLSPDEVALVEALCDRERVVRMSEGIIEGDEVRILSGPLRDHEGIIRKIDRHKRACYVEMWICGRANLIKLGLEIVHKRG